MPRPLRLLVAATASAVAGGIAQPHRPPRPALPRAKLAEPPNRRYAAWMTCFDAERKAQLATPALLDGATDDAVDVIERAFDASDAPTPLERTLNVDVTTYLPDDLLVKVDIATMAHGLEGRSPLLDHHVMEYAARLPARFKVRGGEKKWLLRQLARRRLPPSLVTLPKKGFGVPIDHWFRGELHGFARDVLLGSTAAGRGYYQMAFVDAHARRARRRRVRMAHAAVDAADARTVAADVHRPGADGAAAAGASRRRAHGRRRSLTGRRGRRGPRRLRRRQANRARSYAGPYPGPLTQLRDSPVIAQRSGNAGCSNVVRR